ncbi:MarR family transcriptional regulator [Nonomuraea mesophila]|uniref:MarR family transcriptional regulator n=1 Tax=Nonomuraea mesophila TaxID=2530382 RepID=A0A4R5FRS9_9ACTN|nr:MarR family transcriptional regulator [Nonomuraea mesophila]TDE55911.1 MarR family transcriptional regulator [Nonomuraea mesophila]
MRQHLIDELMLALTDLQNASEMADAAVSERLGLNRTDSRCVAYLITRGPMASGELAELAGLTPGALTVAVDRLEKAGFAERVRDQADRRRVLIRPTEKARALARDSWGQAVKEAEAQFSAYTDEQLVLLTEFLKGQVAQQRRNAERVRDSSTWS